MANKKIMKQRVYRILMGMALSLTTASVCQAMSSLVSLSFEPEWPATPNPGKVVVYQVNAVVRQGSGLLEVSLSSLGLPEGATVQFSPSVLRFTGHSPTNQTAIMTVTCAGMTPTDTCPFTFTGTAARDSITITNRVQQELNSMIVARPSLFLDPLSGGGLRLRGKGTTCKSYTIEATPTLTKPLWTPVGSSTADVNGRFTFFPGAVGDGQVRFFRVAESAPSEAPAQ
jgi:hypothetical protein